MRILAFLMLAACPAPEKDTDPRVDDSGTYTYGDDFEYDEDGDGFERSDGDCDEGDWSVVGRCDDAPHVANANDCDDTDAATHPAADESCNGTDDDCDGETDEGLLGTWYADTDGDGYGDAGPCPPIPD